MPTEGRYRAQLLDRCWTLYLLLTDTFSLHESFHIGFPTVVESALISGALHISVSVTDSLPLSLREAYTFGQQDLTVSGYSYNVIDQHGNNILRADALPHHRRDYRGQPLAHPPHHMHDARRRIQSFSRQIGDFIADVARLDLVSVS